MSKTLTEIAELLKKMLSAATGPEGTGSGAVPKGYTVCGKTGTAQIITSRGDYLGNDYYSVFLGFSPIERPRLAVLVAIEAPRGKYYGGEVAAPVFKEIVRESFNYLNIPPSQNRSDFLKAKDAKPA